MSIAIVPGLDTHKNAVTLGLNALAGAPVQYSQQKDPS